VGMVVINYENAVFFLHLIQSPSPSPSHQGRGVFDFSFI